MNLFALYEGYKDDEKQTVIFENEENYLPGIYESLEVNTQAGKLILEVQSHIGENTVRAISMDSTDGLSRGEEVLATGNPIQMPIGKEINGRLSVYEEIV